MPPNASELGIPYLYDPSMQAPRMTADELRAGFAGARILDRQRLRVRHDGREAGRLRARAARQVPITVMTRGEAGALDQCRGRGVRHPGRPATCRSSIRPGPAMPSGPAWSRAWPRGCPGPVVGRIASLSAVYAIEHAGGQQHHYTLPSFVERYRRELRPRRRRSRSLLETPPVAA